MYLRPSEVFYSQDSINNVFDKRCNHAYKQIGETLDEICEGRCSVNSIPTISVVETDGKWVTADNRRLWVFRQLERLGKCEKIHVQKGYYIPTGKLTSCNGGKSVRVRGSPGGYWHFKPSDTKQPKNVKTFKTPRNIEYRETNVFKNPATNTPNVFSSHRESPQFGNQLSRAPSSYNGGYNHYGTNAGTSSYVNNLNVKNTSHQGTTSVTKHYDIMSPRTSSTFRTSPVPSNQFGEAQNLNKGGFNSYGSNTGLRMNENNKPTRVTSKTGGSSSSSSSSGRVSVNHSKTRTESVQYGARDNKRNDEFTSIYVPEQRVYRHKTYDRSYNGNERRIGNVASYSDRERDNGCCIII